MAWARTVAVVVPSPATSEVWEPKLFSMTTLRPLGPSVTLTASASVLTPLRMASRARWSKRISLADILAFLSFGERGLPVLDDAEDVLLAHDEVLLAVELHLGAGVLGEEHPVPGLDVERPDLAVLEHLAVARGQHLALDRLLLGGVGDDDAALGLLFL